MNSYFVGRRDEQAQLRRLLQASKDGSGKIVTIAGEAGIGKTRLLSEIASMAERQGSNVYWGQMVEDPIAPPYTVWLLVLRAYLRQTTIDDVRQDLGSAARHIATILPELPDVLGFAAPSEPITRDNAALYQLYDAVTRLLLSSAERQPHVLLFDNIHLADQSSLAMLEYVARQISTSRTLLILAHRLDEASARAKFRESLERLSRIAGCEEMRLAGLNKAEVGELLRNVLDTVPPSLIDAVHERGDGNPLFTCQVAASVSSGGKTSSSLSIGSPFAVPDGLDAVIHSRLESIDDAAIHTLETAAVLGRDFDSVLLLRLCGESTTALTAHLDSAVDAGLIGTLGSGRYRFVHALFRESLYGRISAGDRLRLHRAAAEAIEERYATALELPVAELAFHWFEASRGGYVPKAVQRCREAAAAATSKRAFGEASIDLQRALAIAAMADPLDPALELDLLEELGDAQYFAGQQGLAVQSWFKAVQIARHHGWAIKFAKAVLRWQYLRTHTGIAHDSAIAIHEDAIDALPADEEALRTRLAASLATTYHHDHQDERARQKLTESVVHARRLSDPAVLFDCLIKAFYILNKPYEGARRLEMLLEAERIAADSRGLEDQLLAFTAVMFPLSHLGRLDDIRTRTDELESRATAAGHDFWRQVAVGFRVSISIAEGHWAEAMRLAQESFRLGNIEGATGVAGRFGFQMFAIHRALGRLGGVAPLLRQITESGDGARTWLPGRILLHCELGQRQEALEALEQFGDPRDMEVDDLYETNLAYLSDACVQLGDRARCARLYELLAPSRGYCLILQATLVHGAASAYLAQLAAVTGRTGLARQLYEEALQESESLAAPPMLAEVRANFASFLLQTDLHEDRVLAQKLLGQSRAVAEKLQMRALLGRLDDIPTSDKSTASLTGRELDVIRLVATGSSNKAIAESLNISAATVATHLRHILRKTATHNRTEAVMYARSAGLLGRG